jgi:hypothetical protein
VGSPPYSEVVRLFAYADYFWPSIRARYYQIDLLEVPLTEFLDLVYAWIRETLSGEDWQKFEIELEAPLPGTTSRTSQTTAEDEGASFMSAMSTLKMG